MLESVRALGRLGSTTIKSGTRSMSLFSGSSLRGLRSLSAGVFDKGIQDRVTNLHQGFQVHSILNSVGLLGQVRFKSRGNTYQPSTLKRKRTFGFLARLRSKNGRKILSRRRSKARWYLTH